MGHCPLMQVGDALLWLADLIGTIYMYLHELIIGVIWYFFYCKRNIAVMSWWMFYVKKYYIMGNVGHCPLMQVTADLHGHACWLDHVRLHEVIMGDIYTMFLLGYQTFSCKYITCYVSGEQYFLRWSTSMWLCPLMQVGAVLLWHANHIRAVFIHVC